MKGARIKTFQQYGQICIMTTLPETTAWILPSPLAKEEVEILLPLLRRLRAQISSVHQYEPD
ncbi:MAG: hypothetical protein GEU95_10265 [Rhizobiales bacterium]|nr:hypothetical protein [Hyphomicrobiales bacterium]